jgi:hypothetical protein
MCGEGKAVGQGGCPGKHDAKSSWRSQAVVPLPCACGQIVRPVHSIGVVVIQVVNAVLQLITAMAFVNTEDKEADISVQ